MARRIWRAALAFATSHMRLRSRLALALDVALEPTARATLDAIRVARLEHVGFWADTAAVSAVFAHCLCALLWTTLVPMLMFSLALGFIWQHIPLTAAVSLLLWATECMALHDDIVVVQSVARCEVARARAARVQDVPTLDPSICTA